MRPLPLLLIALVLAGCAAPPPTGPSPAAPSERVLYAPDCTLGKPDGNWTESCVAKASGNPSPSKTEIDVAVNPKDPSNVVVGSKDLDRSASNCVWAVPQVTHDGGKTWKTVYIGGKRADRKPGDPLFGWDCVTDPIMTFDKDGVLHYSLQVYNFMTGGAGSTPIVSGTPISNLGSEIVMVSSTDGGDTWGGYVTLHAGDGTGVFHDYMRTTSSPTTGTTFTIWDQISQAVSVPVVVAVKKGATTAQPPVYVPSPDEPGQVAENGIFAGADGAVYVLLQGGSGNVYLAKSTDDGATFSTPAKIFAVKPIDSPLPNTKFRVGTYVEGAIDATSGPHKGCIYTVWTDATRGKGDADVLSSRSCDGGKSWSNATRVNHDLTKSDQWMTRVAVGGDGTVHALYMTRAYDPANKLIDAEYADSTDGGATWATKRLTGKSWDGDLGVHQDGFPFYGDYVGIAATGTRAYAGFPDCVTGVCEVAVAALAKQ
jgi:hypothetical protein